MTEYEASRTLVKSPPELWAELSDPTSLAGHLAEPFGEIRITRLDPETAVAWEGERASGTVRIEPSGWGTRVTLTARAVEGTPTATHEEHPAPAPAPLPLPDPAPEPLPPAAEAPRRGLRARLFGWLGAKRTAAPAPEAPPTAVSPPRPAEAPAEAPPEAPAEAPRPRASEPSLEPDAVLAGVLDKLGAAHHRPFSRS